MDNLQWLTKLIGFNTISSNSNMLLIEAIAVWFKLHHIDSQIIHGPAEGKANLFATIPAKDGQTQGGILLSGHTDVVPVAGQLWATDPFVATEKDGKIYGRGASDMKGFIAVVLALVPEFIALQLSKPIHFAFTYDEEVGCIGVDFLIEYLQKIGIQPEGCIVGEPSNMRPIIGEKSRQVYHCQIQGLAAHSSRADKGCNAIEYASQLICYIRKIANHLREQGPFDNDFDLPYTTISTNIVSGGTATNVIAGTCELLFEVRYLPQFLQQNFRSQIENYINSELLPEMKKIYPEAAIYLNLNSDSSGFVASEDAPITKLVRRITGIGERLKVSYSTEARAYQDAGINTVVCGPGNIEQAHRPNEFITIEQLNICEYFLKNVINLFCLNSSAN
ncbi:acetylornithine deacetylase [Legionella cardiaca]|uniref:Acetylornithine deacetylase n=1 Tax=Legionella cardiaca TaxID=1071983 RepID=A0ABY8AQY6_9GAMM|nr:acetylornithine deacetylase [Legionella cardiaca]WED43065.1 acetylornithine deacetylase [Legionella cardiaca]